MNSLLVKGLVFSTAILLIAACQPPRTAHRLSKPIQPTVVGFVKCKAPRPEVCSVIVNPVCATKDTGMRCFKAPCPATKKVTYSNACSACADEKVYGYLSGGACKK